MKIEPVGILDMMLEPLLGLAQTYWWVIATVLLLAVLRLIKPRRKFRRKGRRSSPYSGGMGRRREPPVEAEPLRPNDPRTQMEAIANARFEPRRLLNRSEYGILLILEKVIGDIGDGHRVMAQTSMGEIVTSKAPPGLREADPRAYWAINSKRLDFLVIDRFGMPALAVEYQGRGHYQGKAFMRDAVKREVLRKAGIKLLEIPADYEDALLKDQIRAGLTPAQAGQRAA